MTKPDLVEILAFSYHCNCLETQFQVTGAIYFAISRNRSSGTSASRTDVARTAHDTPAPHHSERGRDCKAASGREPNSAPCAKGRPQDRSCNRLSHSRLA